MKLYLYLSFRHLDVLRNNRLHFSGVTERADPFENNRPAMSKTPENVPISEEDFKAELRRQYTALPEHMQALVDEDYFCNQLRQKRPAIEKQMRDRQRPGGGKKQLPDPKKLESLALCRLFKSALNPVIWERYGDQYKGFVVELDVRHPYFSDNRYKAQPQVLKPVSYSSDRPSVKARIQPFPALFYRPQPFESEKEYRLVRPKEVCDQSTDLNGREFFFYNFPPSLISRVIIGCNASDEDRKALLQLFSADLRYKKTPVENLWLDSDLFTLHSKPVQKKAPVASKKPLKAAAADKLESAVRKTEHQTRKAPPAVKAAPAKTKPAPEAKAEQDVIKSAPLVKKVEAEVVKPVPSGKKVVASASNSARSDNNPASKTANKPVPAKSLAKSPVKAPVKKTEAMKPGTASSPEAKKPQPDKNRALAQKKAPAQKKVPVQKAASGQEKTQPPKTAASAVPKPVRKSAPDDKKLVAGSKVEADSAGKARPERGNKVAENSKQASSLSVQAELAKQLIGGELKVPAKKLSAAARSPEMAVIRPRKKKPAQ